MKKSVLSVALCVAMLLTMMASLIAMPAQAATVVDLFVPPYANDPNYATVSLEDGVATVNVTEGWNKDTDVAYGMAIEPLMSNVDLTATPDVALALESDVPFRITLLDRNEAGEMKWISFGAEFFNSVYPKGGEALAASPEAGFFPAGTYDCTAYLAGVYTWKDSQGEAGWDVTKANITAVYIELKEAGTLSLSKLELKGDSNEPALPMGELVTFTVGTVDAKPGDIVEIPFSISENHYIVNGQLRVNYDPAKLEMQQVWDDIDNPYFESYDTGILRNAMVAFAVQTPGEGNLAFASSGSKGTAKAGTIFTLTFKVLDGFTGKADITLTTPELSSNNGEINSGSDYATNVEVINGGVNVAGSDVTDPTDPSQPTDPGVTGMKGDMDGDGKITIKDAVTLYYFVNGKMQLSDDQLALADMDGDTKINIKDAVTLYYIVNGKM